MKVQLIILMLLSFLSAMPTFAAQDQLSKQAQADLFEFHSPQAQQRAIYLSQQLRCPRCQNQNLTESNAPIALDMRLKVYELVEEGLSDQAIFDYMTDRFGEFVLYKPKLQPATYILWGTPFVLLIIFIIIILRKYTQRDKNINSHQ